MRDNDSVQTILIATSNPGKFEELTAEFNDLPFNFVNLKDVKLDGHDVDEPYETTEENAIHKARFFAQKSRLLTIAEDTGFFIKHLEGWPGVKTKRAAKTAEERIALIIKKMAGLPQKKRAAYFETSACLYNPISNNFHVFKGIAEGRVVNKVEVIPRKGMELDALFYSNDVKKVFATLSPLDKNTVSHRGKVVTQLKIFIQKMYGFKQIVVPLALIYKNKKLLLLKRRDSRPEFNNKWEFPGGGVEKKENIEACLKRECLEETGFEVKIEEQLPSVMTHYEKKWNYQVFLVTYVCSIVKGRLALMDHENCAMGWFTLDEARLLDFLPLNKRILEDNIAILKKYFN